MTSGGQECALEWDTGLSPGAGLELKEASLAWSRRRLSSMPAPPHSHFGTAIFRRPCKSTVGGPERLSRAGGRVAAHQRNLQISVRRCALSPTDRILGQRAFQRADWLSLSAFVRQAGIATTATVTLVGGGVPVGTTFSVSDSFNATSTFHGLDLGIIGEFTQGPWLLEWRAKVALGANFNEA